MERIAIISVVLYFIKVVRNIAKAITNADVIICLVEWSEITSFNFPEVAKDSVLFIDARNQFNPAQMQKKGYTYQGVGISE